MKTMLLALVLGLHGTAFAGTELTTVIPFDAPFQPEYYLYNQTTGIISELQGGTVTNQARVIPRPGSRNPATMPFIPPSRPRAENYWSSPDMAIDLNQQLDRDLNRMLGLPD